MSIRRKPPTGITIIAALGALDGLWHVLGGLLRVLGGIFDPIGLVVGGVLIALGLAQIVVMYGLWNMDEWGWTWTVRLLGLIVGVDLLGILFGQGGILRLGLTLGILAYVYSQKTKYVRATPV